MPVDEGTVATSAIPGRSEPSRFPDTATVESVPHPGSRPSKGLRGIAPDALALTLIFLLGDGHDFTLAAAYGISSDDTYRYYVKPDIADHDEIVRNIRSMDFSSVLDGVAQNYAGRPESAC
jgi:hypothetical protein